MTIILPALAVAFAAVCVWLTVRIVNRRERWAKWTLAAVLSLPVLYVASFGPACWISSKMLDIEDDSDIEAKTVSVLYRPLLRLALRGNFSDALISYARLYSSDDWQVALYGNGPIWARFRARR